jgi:hypothetical protein
VRSNKPCQMRSRPGSRPSRHPPSLSLNGATGNSSTAATWPIPCPAYRRMHPRNGAAPSSRQPAICWIACASTKRPCWPSCTISPCRSTTTKPNATCGWLTQAEGLGLLPHSQRRHHLLPYPQLHLNRP